MTATCFVGTNALVYARDASEPKKQAAAAAWMRRLWETQTGRLSVQVLNEFYVIVTQKLKPGLDRQSAKEEILTLMAWEPVPIDAEVMRRAWLVQDTYSFSWWDALIISAALRSGCRFLLSEDMQAGQDLFGLKIVNPFRTPPDSFLS